MDYDYGKHHSLCRCLDCMTRIQISTPALCSECGLVMWVDTKGKHHCMTHGKQEKLVVCIHGRINGFCDVVGCQHHLTKLVCENLPCKENTMPNKTPMEEAIELIIENRNRFFEYYANHKLKALTASDPKVSEIATEKANINYNAAYMCQQFLNKYPLPFEVK